MHLSQHDIYICLIAIAAIAVALLSIVLTVKNNWFNKLIGRRLLHLIAISTCAFAINYFENRILLGYILISFFVLLLWIIRKGWMQVNDYKTYGIAVFPLAFAVLLFIPLLSKFTIVYAALILAISDAAAGICVNISANKKSSFFLKKNHGLGLLHFILLHFLYRYFILILFLLMAYYFV